MEINYFISKKTPLWSEIRTLLESIYGRATIILSLISPVIYFMSLPEHIENSVKIISIGTILIITANVLFTLFIPSVQRNYPRYLDYEKKCIGLAKGDALDIYEEFGQIVGEIAKCEDWERTGHAFPYLDNKNKIPLLDDYKKNFTKSSSSENESLVVNIITFTRSLATIKYVLYDSSKTASRAIISLLIIAGIVMIYGPQLYRVINWIVG